MPFIVTAEICSWYAVITTNYLVNTIENSIWAVTFLLIAIAPVRLMTDFHGATRWATRWTVAGIASYLAFLVDNRCADVLRALAGRPGERQAAARHRLRASMM